MPRVRGRKKIVTHSNQGDQIMKGRNLGARILDALQEKGWDQRKLAKQTGLSEGTISYYISNKRSPKFQFLARIAHVLDKSISYFIDEEKPESQKAGRKTNQRLVPVFDLPFIKFINWNEGSYPRGIYPLAEPTDSGDPNAFLIRARGENMTGRIDDERSIIDNDLLLIEPTRKPLDGDICICHYENHGIRVEKFKKHQKESFLIPLNENCPPTILGPDNAGDSISIFPISEIKRKLKAI